MPKRKQKIIEGLEITDVAAEGKSMGKHEGKVVFVPYTAPGDIVDVRIHRSKSSFSEGSIIKYLKKSEKRVTPACNYFGTCGGCKWQHLPYHDQLAFKANQVRDQFLRIGKFNVENFLPIIGSENEYAYRNKLEYTFSFRRWLTADEIQSGDDMPNREGLGFHMPGKFDKVLDIDECHLMDARHNALRNEIRQYAIENGISFFNVHEFKGALRNLVIRNTTTGEWMVVLLFGEPVDEKLTGLLAHVKNTFPWITSLMYIVNQKKNDTYLDLEEVLYTGKDHIIEKLGDLQFKISVKSFFQTNSYQAKKLYDVAKDFADLQGTELVYDLYTGTGTIACYIANKAQKVIGVEYVPEAIEDAFVNAQLNGITNTDFYAGDMRQVLNDDFITKHGQPDVIMVDPPRAGMHEDVVNKLLEIAAEKVVYISCNPATQARDVAMMSEKYEVVKSQPVDMFPHTHHVENVVLLELKK